MTCKKNIAIMTGLILAASLITASFTALFLFRINGRLHMQALGGICREIIENQPEAEHAVLSALKEYQWEPEEAGQENLLFSYGYEWEDFLAPAESRGIFFCIAGSLAGGICLLLAFLGLRKRNETRVEQLTEYLEQVNSGGTGDLFQLGEDGFSRLQDEIYKTVTQLQQTKDAALAAKRNFAENLSNIAHQIKTPITAISLSVQMMKTDTPEPEPQLEQIHRQLARLTYLEEALLLLSRIDAGTLTLERKEVDVFTLLTLAADNLQELLDRASVSVSIPEAGEAVVHADLDWTMEAVMNLLKNCMEHTPPGGTVHCSYEQNLLYTRIRIWDTGQGFGKEDIPHLFQRFYRGKNRKNSGIGIGLAISKAIIESQNGTVTARNLPAGGACFEIHFYSH